MSFGNLDAGKATVGIGADDASARKTVDGFVSYMNRAATKLQGFGRGIAGGGAALSAPFVAGVVASTKFDDKLREIAAKTGEDAAGLKRLRDAAMRLGPSAGGPIAVAEGLLELAKAGNTVEESITAVPAAMNLARAEGGDFGVGQAAELLSDLRNSFKLQAKDSERIADTLASAANLSTTGVMEMGLSFSYVAPQAAAAGQSIETMSAAIATLANRGIKGQKAGTGLRGVFNELANPDKEKAFAKLGVKVKDAVGNFRPFPDIMRELGAATRSLPSVERAATFQNLFGAEASNSALILSDNADAVADLAVQMAKANGTAAQMAATMNAGLGGAWRRSKGQAEAIAIVLGDAVAPNLQKALDRTAPLAVEFTKLAEANQELVAYSAAGAAGVTALGSSMVAAGYAANGLAMATDAARWAGTKLLAVNSLLAKSHLRTAATATVSATAHTALAAAQAVAAAGPVGLIAVAVGLGAVVTAGQALIGLGIGKFFVDSAKQSSVARLTMFGWGKTIEYATNAAKTGWNLASAAAARYARGIVAIGKGFAKYLDPREALRGAVLFGRYLAEPILNRVRGLAAAAGPLVSNFVDSIGNQISGGVTFATKLAQPALNWLSGFAALAGREAAMIVRPFTTAVSFGFGNLRELTVGTGQFLYDFARVAAKAGSETIAAFRMIGSEATKSFGLVFELAQSGQWQSAFDLAGKTTSRSLKLGFLQIELAWIDVTEFMGQAFDKFIRSVVRRFNIGVRDMVKSLLPIAQRIDRISGTDPSQGLAQFLRDRSKDASSVQKNLNRAMGAMGQEIAAENASRRSAIGREVADLAAGFATEREEARRAEELRKFTEALGQATKAAQGFLFDQKGRLTAFDRAKEGAFAAGEAVGSLLAQIPPLTGALEAGKAALAADAAFSSRVFSGASVALAGMGIDDSFQKEQLKESQKQTGLLGDIKRNTADGGTFD